jgi:exonuclease III
MRKILSYNVNGIRSATKKGLLDWIKAVDPDIICFQEMKAHTAIMPTGILPRRRATAA